MKIFNKNGELLLEVPGDNLQDANLRGAKMQEANLQDAKLHGVNLQGANLLGANLLGAIIDGEKVKVQPVVISSFKYFIMITDSRMRIGCQVHTHDEWATMSDNRIPYHDIEAWHAHRDMLLAVCRWQQGIAKSIEISCRRS